MDKAGRALMTRRIANTNRNIPPHTDPLPQEFYLRPTLDVAQDLLGAYFMRTWNGRTLGGYIVEVEAYHQHGDESSHSYNGCTERNAVMFQPGGRLYVYFTYGMHFCMNAVTEKEGVGAAVLIRAIEPVEGLEDMRIRRPKAKSERDLANGPAKACQAFAIARNENGTVLTSPELCIVPGIPVARRNVERTHRIGIRKSEELPWRFAVKDNYFLSLGHGRKRLHP